MSWKLVLFMTVLSTKSLVLNADFISQLVNGTLKRSVEFNFIVFGQESKGVILCCWDSERNYFELSIFLNIGEKNVKITYNKTRLKIPLYSLCGSSSGKDLRLQFFILFSNEYLSLGCNNESRHTLFVSQNVNETSIDNFPLVLVNVTGKIFIMLGNKGGFMNEYKTFEPKIKDQFSGCLHNFHFNGISQNFLQNGTRMKSSCPENCDSTLCNGGICHKETSEKSILCNCSMVPFNGRHCNNSMRYYKISPNNTFEKINKMYNISFKMTWKSSVSHWTCLLEIAGKEKYFTIRSNVTHLLLNSSAILNINPKDVNFINVNVKGTYLFINVNNKNINTNISLGNDVKLFVGWSKSNGLCQTFEGQYDLDFDKSELRKVDQLEIKEFHTTKPNIKEEYEHNNLRIILMVVLGCVFLCSTLVIVLHFRKNKEIKMEIDKVKAVSELTLSKHKPLVFETQIYGHVQDDNQYDYIEKYGKNTLTNSMPIR